ncbi:hypothetical protein BD779DRAFT_1675596 [Infundibulicybe gibba]|nr:hypothetical protein BD779DRAFT_1675596 [Infundibulicybe gibba]
MHSPVGWVHGDPVWEHAHDAAARLEDRRTTNSATSSAISPWQPANTAWATIELPSVQTSGSDVDGVDRPLVVPPALSEESYVRMAYLHAAIGSVYSYLSATRATGSLNVTLGALHIANALPVLPRPVRTLENARQVDELLTPACAVLRCTGLIHEGYTGSKGRGKWRPFKANPHASIIQTLRRFFMRPGFTKLIKDGRDHQRVHAGDENFAMRDTQGMVMLSDGGWWS